MPGAFDESLHPRAADGKFGSGGGSSQGPKTKPTTAREKAAIKRQKEKRAAAKVKARAIVTRAKERAKVLVDRAKAMQPRGKVPTNDAKAKVAAARAAAKAKAKEIVAKAKEKAAATIAKHAPESAANSAKTPKTTKAKADSRAPVGAEHHAASEAPPPHQSEHPMSTSSFRERLEKTQRVATPDEIDATKTYAGPWFSNINKSLRSPGSPVREKELVDHTIKHLDSLMEKSKLDAPVTTFRGSDSHAAIASLKVGDSFTDHAYVSTSVDERAAFGGDVFMRITSPPGTKAAPIGGTAADSEAEILIGRGARMRLDKIETRKHPEHGYDQTVMHFTVVGQG